VFGLTYIRGGDESLPSTNTLVSSAPVLETMPKCRVGLGDIENELLRFGRVGG
jgi:hypothetical protein